MMRRATISKYWLFLIALYAVLLSLPLSLRIIGPHTLSEMIPSLPTLVLWALPLYLLYKIRNLFNRLLGLTWVLWFIVGSVNLIASYDYYGESYRLNADTPAIIYILFLSVLLLGIWLFERKHSKQKLENRAQNSPLQPLTPFFSTGLLLFPFLWFGSLVISIGYIPILQALGGENIVWSMYALNYGPLYGYMLINAPSILIALDKFYVSRGGKRYFYLCLIIIFAFFVIASGKRHIIILAMLAILTYLVYDRQITLTRAFFFLLITGGLYIGLEILRQGSDAAKFSTFLRKFLTIGHEYRTFAYVVNHFKPGEIIGYNWAMSTLAAAVNRNVLRVMGFNKITLVQMSSAYAWRYIFYSEFGIRSNLIAELYMAYGWPGMTIILVFGIIVAWVTNRMTKTRSRDNLIFLCIAYATLMLALVDSSDDVVGSLTLLFYVWIINRLCHLLVVGLRSSGKIPVELKSQVAR